MSDRLKIMACGSIERETVTLEEVQFRIYDTKTMITYNVFCYRDNDEEDIYHVEVKDLNGNKIDECTLDSDGGVLMDDEFKCDEFDVNFGDDLIELITNHFIIPF